MTLGVFLLVLFAATCHAGWNYAARKVSGNLVVIWLALLCGNIVLFPFAMGWNIYNGFSGSMSVSGVGYIMASGVIHSIYFILLAYAYKLGEISVVYPIARGSGVGLTAILAWLILNEEVSIYGAVGIVLILAGIISMGLPIFNRTVKIQGLGLALSVGSIIMSYSLIDNGGVSRVDPVLYMWLMGTVTTILMLPYVFYKHAGTIMQTFKEYYTYILIIGMGSISSYLIILIVFTLGSVSYIVAVREFAVVIGALLGIIFMKEQFTLAKVVGIASIVFGLICIKGS